MQGTSVDELQAWQMAPYVEAVLSQPRSRPLLRAAAKLYKCALKLSLAPDLTVPQPRGLCSSVHRALGKVAAPGVRQCAPFRGRHERTRARTRERALLTLQQLADAASAPQPHAGSRMRYAFSVAAPYSSTLRRELGEQLVSCGMIGAAMSLFEELELWDNLILCYQLLQKKPQVRRPGVEVLKPYEVPHMKSQPGASGPPMVTVGALAGDPAPMWARCWSPRACLAGSTAVACVPPRTQSLALLCRRRA